MEAVDLKNEKNDTASTPKYVPPMIKVLESKDLLATFQVSVNANTWWGAM
jgi:hypothetical protein